MNKILAGFVVGLLFGILIAPDKGSETRERINSKANDLKDKFDDLVDSIAERFESFKKETEIVAETVKDNIRSGSPSFAGESNVSTS